MKFNNIKEEKVIETILKSGMEVSRNGNLVIKILANSKDFQALDSVYAKKYENFLPTVTNDTMFVQIIYRYNRVRTIFAHEDGKTPMCSQDFKEGMKVRIELKMNTMYKSDEGTGFIWMAHKVIAI